MKNLDNIYNDNTYNGFKKINSRQKMIVCILHALGKEAKTQTIHNAMALYMKKKRLDTFEFIRRADGLYSFSLDREIQKLKGEWVNEYECGKLKFICPRDIYTSMIHISPHAHKKKMNDLIDFVKDEITNLSEAEIMADVNNVAIVTTDSAQDRDQDQDQEQKLFTIGYEGISLENYLNRLIRRNIKLVCDVRRNPISRKYGFSKTKLSETLQKINVDYIHLPELGIVSEKRWNLKKYEDYMALFSEYETTTLCNEQETLNHLIELLKSHNRIAITCFESEHFMCHRGCISKNLLKRPGWSQKIEHI